MDKKKIWFLYNSRFSGYDADYRTLLITASETSTIPSPTKQVKENAAMIAIKAVFGVTSIASAPIIQGLMFKTDGDSNYATYNWVNPSIRKATLVSSPTFTSDTGFNSNGSSSYINTNVKLTDLTQTDFSIAARSYTNAQQGSSLFGARDASGTTTESLVLAPRDATNNCNLRFIDNTTTITQVGDTDSTNRWLIGRTDASNVHHGINGAALTNVVKTLDAAENARDIFLLALNDGGAGALSFNTRGISYCWIFSRKLTNAEWAAFDAAIVNYLS